MEACRLKDVLHGSIRHEYFYSEVTGQTESCLVYAPPGYDRDQLRLPVLYLRTGSEKMREAGSGREESAG